MLKIFAFIALGVSAYDKCKDQQGGAVPRISSPAQQGDKFCEKFCSKYPGSTFRGTCGIQTGYTACYRVVAFEGETETKTRFCEPSECVECLDYINKGGFCDCGYSCYENVQSSPLESSNKRFSCSRFYTV